MIELFKPRIRPDQGHWSCAGLGREGAGRTPRAAYFDWLNECSLYPYA